MVSLGPSAQATLEHDTQMFSLVIPQLNSTWLNPFLDHHHISTTLKSFEKNTAQ
jgi:hypothetical protein